MSFQLTTRGLADGPQVMDGADLVLIVLDDTYVFSPEHEYEDIESYEATGAAYVRMTAAGRASLTDRVWSVWADDPTTCDLTDDARSGVAVLRDTGSALVFVGWSDDPDGPVPLYEPTWPDGLWDQPVESIDGLLAQMVTSVAGVSPVGGDVDAEDLATALSPYIDGGDGGGGGGGDAAAEVVWGSVFVSRSGGLAALNGATTVDLAVSTTVGVLPVGFRPAMEVVIISAVGVPDGGGAPVPIVLVVEDDGDVVVVESNGLTGEIGVLFGGCAFPLIEVEEP